MVKEGWKEVKLDVLYEFRSGLSKGKKFFGSGYPFLTYKEIKDYPNATFNGFAKRLRPKNNEIYPEYAVCYFRSEKFRNKAASMCSLITRASLNNDDLSHLTISYPKYDIQKKNATILLNYDLLMVGFDIELGHNYV
jgi:type I restriction enzyme S subunit